MRHNKVVIFTTAVLLIFALLAPILYTGYGQIRKAEAARQTNDDETAMEAYSRAADLLPWRKDLWEQAGLAAGRREMYAEAIALLKRAPVLSEEGWLTLGYSYYLTGDLESAQAAFENGISGYSSAQAFEGLALVHRLQGDRLAERAALESQLRLDDDVRARYRLGLLLAVLDPEKALPELMLAASLDPQFDPAVQTLRAALQNSSANPGSSGQMVRIGRALALVHEWDLSLSAFEKAIEHDAEDAEAWAWFGEAQQQTGQDGRAALDRAVTLDHTSVTVRALRGLYWNRQGRYEQMLAEYLLATRYEPENPAWQASIGDAYINLGDLASAFNAYQHATELAPGESIYWRLLAVFCADNGVRVEDVGLPAAQKAVELSPDDPLALDALGFSYFSTGRFSNAEQTLLIVTRVAPPYLPAHIHLAMTYLAQGNRSAALSELNHVREADKDGADGVLAEQLIRQFFP